MGTLFRAPIDPAWSGILTPAAISFVNELARHFAPTVASLLARREQRQAEIDAGALPDFLEETRGIREGDHLP